MIDESTQTEHTVIPDTGNADPGRPSPDDPRSASNITMVVYGLQAATFLTVITLIAAVIVNYVKKDDVRGTWLESHFRWQIRTFWYSLLWSILGAVTYILIIGHFILLATVIWFIYRVARGWMRLIEKKPMYV